MTPQEPAMDVSELLPCPFCGGVPRIDESSETFIVVCGPCGSAGDWYPERDDAIIAWNTRAALPHMQPAGEAAAYRKVIEAVKIRLHFMNWPGESMWDMNAGTGKRPFWTPDWRYEISLIENALHGTPVSERAPAGTIRRNEITTPPQPSAEPQQEARQAWTQCPKCECWFQPPTTPTTLPDGSLLKSLAVQQEAQGAGADALNVVNEAANDARHRGDYQRANALVRARVALFKAATPPAPVDMRRLHALADRVSNLLTAWGDEEMREERDAIAAEMRAAANDALLSAQPSADAGDDAIAAQREADEG